MGQQNLARMVLEGKSDGHSIGKPLKQWKALDVLPGRNLRKNKNRSTGLQKKEDNNK